MKIYEIFIIINATLLLLSGLILVLGEHYIASGLYIIAGVLTQMLLFNDINLTALRKK